MDQILVLKAGVDKTSPLEFLRSYFKKSNPATYTTDGKKQCHRSAGRTLGDLTLLTKSYLPEVTQDQVAGMLVKLDEEQAFSILRCGTVNNTVFHPKCNYSYNFGFTDNTKRFSCDVTIERRMRVGGKGLSINEIYELGTKYNEKND